mmetsp:Transcript_7624/g.21808  ORF Transcript_7624/g.21808 Transcript_7624/m.21808 type:complete len:316 (+) Transcript_7624:575-1522(+)
MRVESSSSSAAPWPSSASPSANPSASPSDADGSSRFECARAFAPSTLRFLLDRFLGSSALPSSLALDSSFILTPMTSPLSYLIPSFFQKSKRGTILLPLLLVLKPPIAWVLTTASSSSLNLANGDFLGRPGLPLLDDGGEGPPGDLLRCLGFAPLLAGGVPLDVVASSSSALMESLFPFALLRGGLKSSLKVSLSSSPSSMFDASTSAIAPRASRASFRLTLGAGLPPPPAAAPSASRTSSQFSGTPSAKSCTTFSPKERRISASFTLPTNFTFMTPPSFPSVASSLDPSLLLMTCELKLSEASMKEEYSVPHSE